MPPSPIFCQKIVFNWICKRKQCVIRQAQTSGLFLYGGCVTFSFTYKLISNCAPFSCRLARWCEKRKYSETSVSFVTWQAVAGRIPAMASDQQTFCCQHGASGPGQGSDGQVTSFFPSCAARTLQEGWPATWQDVRNRPLDVSKSRHS